MIIRKKNVSLKFLLSIPILLLLFTIVFSTMSSNKPESANYNPYLKEIPEKYAKLIGKDKINDSVFFSGIAKDNGLRELVIFKKQPNENELKWSFIVELYPSKKKHLKGGIRFLTFNIAKEPILFNYNKSAYAIFKIALPMIDIERLIIKNKPTKWEEVIVNPFKKLPSIKNNALLEVEKGKQLTTPSPYSFLFEKTLKQNKIEILPSSFKIRNDALFKEHHSVSDYSTNFDKTIVEIQNPNSFWKSFINHEDKSIKLAKFNGKQSAIVSNLLKQFIKSEIPFNAVFDTYKLATYNAIKQVFIKRCNEGILFVFNEESNLLEPLYINSNCLGFVNRNIEKPIITNSDYLNYYTNALYDFSQFNFQNEIREDNTLFNEELALINYFDANVVFDFDVIKVNQRVIRKSLNPSIALKAELISINSKKMTISVFNISNYPIDILGLNHDEKKEIVTLDNSTQVLSNQKDTIIIDLPRSFENLFVSKKKKVVGFVLPKHIYQLSLKYKIPSLNQSYTSPIIPYQKSIIKEEDIFRSERFINNHKNIIVDEEKNEITFSKDSIVISSALIIPKGFVFKLKPGTTINISDGGKIISYSPLSFIGTNINPIQIISSDKKGQGILILADGEQSNLAFVDFINLRNPKHGHWGVTGAVTFYESPVNLESVSVKNNRCEDALNIVRTKFKMNNCTISGTQSDAFDGDFVVGTISNSTFRNLGNDAIDVSGSDLIIKNVNIIKAGDKGLSAGENSKMKIQNVNISNSEIGIAGKDLSIVEAKKLKISNTKLGFTAFQKKPEFGPSNITVSGIEMEDVGINYLIESSSSLFIDGKKIETSQNVKDRMYGAEFGISSEETRNSK